VLRTYGRETAGAAVIREAISQGITYFDSAQAYSDSETYYGKVWSEHPDLRTRVFQTSKSARRTRREALDELESTLDRMGIDHLDLWQIHDIRTEEDLRIISGPGGALEAFLEAKAAGKVHWIGVTGHHDPHVLTRAVMEWPVDSVLLPVNPVERVLGGFLDHTLHAATEKGLAVIGMKVLGAGHYIAPQAGITAEMLIRFALSHPITLAIVGCANPDQVKILAREGRQFHPMSSEEQDQIIDRFRPHAQRLAYYRGVR
jgi:predicted aldo/keto reductase-like oxidoreductase